MTEQIKRDKINVFRRLYIKRRSIATGQFETDWQDLSEHVVKWGSYQSTLDEFQKNKFKFNNAQLTVSNETGVFNDYDNEFSFWYGYAPPSRSLVKIEAGLFIETLSSSYIYSRSEYPTTSTLFIGVMSNSPNLDQNDNAVLNLTSIMNVLREYPARNLTGFTVTGQTASKAIEVVRDHRDSSANYIFRPFFGDTISNWTIETTTANYDGLNTGASEMIRSMNTWDVIEKLAEAEGKITYIDREGKFYFRASDVNTSTSQFTFAGNYDDADNGQTITKLKSVKKDISNYYSRVEVQFNSSDTYTSYIIHEATLTVSGTNNPWIYGQKTYQIQNYWIANTATAQTLAAAIFNRVSEIKRHIEIDTTFLPQLNILDKVTLNYTLSERFDNDVWDVYSWSGETDTSDDLYWTENKDPSEILNASMKIIGIKHDLDNITSSFTLREL